MLSMDSARAFDGVEVSRSDIHFRLGGVGPRKRDESHGR
jgi:hypothetical protein